MRTSLVLTGLVALAIAGCGDDTTGADLGPDLAATPDLSASPDLTAPADLTPEIDAAPGDGMEADAFMCTANQFISCAGTTATYCNANGTGLSTFDCVTACGSGATGCGQCTADVCTAGSPSTFTPCDTAHSKAGTTTNCVTLQAGGNTSLCASATACQQCAGSFVCGDGANYGTVLNTSYACSSGTVQTAGAKTCAFGCDPSNGLCRDFIPANQARLHLDATGTADVFTCTGTQDATLPAVVANAGETLAIDTTARTITVGATTYTARWGTAYKPTDSSTNAIVAHIKSLSVTNATVAVTGANALILLVDGDVTMSGAVGAVTLVKLNATATTSGPGGPSASGTGGTSSGDNGGGGAGHGTTGAAGGPNSATGGSSTGGTAGPAYGGTTGTEILEAGAAGGANGTTGAGGGGGALQISACGVVTVGANVIFNASGGGGRGGGTTAATSGGTGGGSGGAILLEGASFAGNAIAGELVANGAGGGGGGALGNPAMPGKEWDPTTTPTTVPTGGTAGATNAGAGGNGGVQGTVPTVGGSASALATNGGGGGGGAVGRVFLNASSIATAPTATASSPTPKVSTTCVTTNGAPPASCTYP